jgi:hypothetical protein
MTMYHLHHANLGSPYFKHFEYSRYPPDALILDGTFHLQQYLEIRSPQICLPRRYAIMNCVKQIPDMLISVIFSPLAMLFLILLNKIPAMLILVPHLPQAMPLYTSLQNM